MPPFLRTPTPLYQHYLFISSISNCGSQQQYLGRYNSIKQLSGISGGWSGDWLASFFSGCCCYYCPLETGVYLDRQTAQADYEEVILKLQAPEWLVNLSCMNEAFLESTHSHPSFSTCPGMLALRGKPCRKTNSHTSFHKDKLHPPFFSHHCEAGS